MKPDEGPLFRVLGLKLEVTMLTTDKIDVPTKLVHGFRHSVLHRCIEVYRPLQTAADYDLFNHCDKLGEQDQRRLVEEFFQCVT